MNPSLLPLEGDPSSFLVLAQGKAIRSISLARKAKLPAEIAGDPPQDILVGLLGDNPHSAKLRYLICKDAFGSALVLLDTQNIEADFPFPVGKSFTKKDAQDKFAFL